MWLYYFLKTKFFEWHEQKAVQKKLYPHAPFQEKDQALLAAYKGVNPYRLSKEYLAAKGADDLHQYGETPVTTMAYIAECCGLSSRDTVIEMGAGRGRSALFLSEYVGCQVIAYEQIPEFGEKMIDSANLTFCVGDMHNADFSLATVVYLYGTMLKDQEILKLIDRFPKGCKIITVSFPLDLYSANYHTSKQFQGRFPWGKTEVYLNERTR